MYTKYSYSLTLLPFYPILEFRNIFTTTAIYPLPYPSTQPSRMSPLHLFIPLLFHLTAASRFSLDGYITHGDNIFNNRPIVDYTESSSVLNTLGPVPEVGVLTPRANNASTITDAVPPTALLATIDAYAFRTGLGIPQGIGPFNIPLAKTPTTFAFSTNINDRIPPNSFKSSSDPAVLSNPYLSKQALRKITVADWNRASARISGRCRDGRATVKVELRDGLPNGLYTLWDVGSTNFGTDAENLLSGLLAGCRMLLSPMRWAPGLLFANSCTVRQILVSVRPDAQSMLACSIIPIIWFLRAQQL